MTQVVTYICKECNARFGPMGFHGYNPKSKTGEIPGICKMCKEIIVLKLEKGVITNEICPKCKNSRILFEGHCPICKSNQMVFSELNMPGYEQKAKKVQL
jgi:hypothetical protein